MLGFGSIFAAWNIAKKPNLKDDRFIISHVDKDIKPKTEPDPPDKEKEE